MDGVGERLAGSESPTRQLEKGRSNKSDRELKTLTEEGRSAYLL